MVKPRISIVLPTYNQAQYLEDALGGIYCQTSKEYELIVVNDGSTDNTPEVLAKLGAKMSFQVITQDNQGLPNALNAGFRQAAGEYLTWTSTDNIMHPAMLERLAAHLDQNPGDGMVYADWEIINSEGHVLRQVTTFEFNRHLLMRINFINACFLYRKTCQDAIGWYDPAYQYVEDWEYWLRLSRQFKVVHYPHVLYQFRIHDQSLTEKVVRKAGGTTPGMNLLLRNIQTSWSDWLISKIVHEWTRMRIGCLPRDYLHSPILR